MKRINYCCVSECVQWMSDCGMIGERNECLIEENKCEKVLLLKCEYSWIGLLPIIPIQINNQIL